MYSKNRFILITFFLVMLFLLGIVFSNGLVLAAENSTSANNSAAESKTIDKSDASASASIFDYTKEPDFKGLVPCGTDEDNVPCTLCHFLIGIQRLFKYGLYLVTTLVFMGVFIAGAMHLVSFGSEDLMTKSKLFLGASLKGFGIVLGSWVIITSIMNIAPIQKGLGIGKTNWYTFTCNMVSSATLVTFEKPMKGELQSVEIQCEAGVASDITLDDDANTDKSDNYQLKAIAKYSNGDSEDVTQKATWSAVDETIAKVNSGKVQGIKIGYTSIRASYSEGGSESQAASVNVFMNTCPLSAAPDDEEESEEISSIFQYPLKPANIFKKITNSAHAAKKISECKACMKKTSSKCKLLAGNKNAMFNFILVRANCGSNDSSLEKYLLGDSICKKWDNSKGSYDFFVEKTKTMAVGLNYIKKENRSNFAVYRLDTIYNGSNDNEYAETIVSDCPEAADGKFMSFGYIYNSLLGVPFAVFGADNAFYTLLDNNQDLASDDVKFAHEQIGHAFAKFRDEYDKKNEGDVGILERLARNSLWSFPYANVTKDKNCQKWKGITSGCFEGCDYKEEGCFRSSDNSIMRNPFEVNGKAFNMVQHHIISKCVENYAECPPKELKEIVIY